MTYQINSSLLCRSLCVVGGLVSLVGVICWLRASEPASFTENSVHYGKVLPVRHTRITFKPAPVIESAYLRQRDGGVHYMMPQQPSDQTMTDQEVDLYRAFTQTAAEPMVVLKQLVHNAFEVHAGDALLLVQQSGKDVTIKASSDGVAYFPKGIAPGHKVDVGDTIAVIGHPQAIGNLLVPLPLLAVLGLAALWIYKTREDNDDEGVSLEDPLQQPSPPKAALQVAAPPAPAATRAFRTLVPAELPVAYRPVPPSAAAGRAEELGETHIAFKRDESGKSEASTRAPEETLQVLPPLEEEQEIE